MLDGSVGQKFLTVKSSMAAFVPFFTSELYEDGGFLLGENMHTGHPVQWNPNNRLNRNTVLAATSGSGKTTVAMMIIHEFEKMYPESFIFGIDPESEYKALGDNMGFHYVNYSQGQKMGLDTFKLLPDTVSATETLCDVMNVPELERTLPMFAASKMSAIPVDKRSFFKFYEILKELEATRPSKVFQPSAYFDIMTQPPFSHLFEGEPPKNKKMILSLKNMGSPGSTTHRIITQIALNYAMSQCIMMPKIIPKLIMLDEVWMLLQHKSLGNTIDNISRRGRKYNVDLMMATQNIEDMTDNVAARNVLVNRDTVIFLRQSEVTAKSLLKHFVLSDEEIKLLLKLKKGQALIRFGDDAVPVNILPDESQLELFRPK